MNKKNGICPVCEYQICRCKVFYCPVCEKEVKCKETEVAFKGSDKSYIGYFCPICDNEFENRGYEDE